MRYLRAVGLIAALAASACSGDSSSPTGPGASRSMTGTWIGTASDSSGSMMGAGLTAGMMAGTTWQVTQAGNTFSGTMQFPGHMAGGMTVSGTISGNIGTFTMTMASGSMMNGACTASATGTFDMDDMMAQFHGTYAGMNSCMGAFDHGEMSMHR